MTGSSPSATATSSRPSAASQSMRPSLCVCQCMKVELRSIFCMRYMPTLRVPVRGSFVITAGSVMNGAGSPGQQRWIGQEVEVDVVAGEDDLLARARPRRVFGIESAIDFRRLRPLHLLHEPLRRLHLEHLAELRGDGVEARLAERHAHAALGAELVDQERM